MKKIITALDEKDLDDLYKLIIYCEDSMNPDVVDIAMYWEEVIEGWRDMLGYQKTS